MKNILLFLSIALLLGSCGAVEKYNQQISKLHSPEELHEDVNYTYKLLQDRHPDLYWYISKDSLDKHFSDLKKSITDSISSQDFYKKLAPVIASIKQGHTNVYPPSLRQTKDDKKTNGKRHNPFRQLSFKPVKKDIYIANNYGKDSTILVGSKLLRIENKPIDSLLDSFKNLTTGDGYNTSFIPIITRKYIGYFYTKTHSRKDSILLHLEKNDSIYTKYIYAYEKKSKKDSLKETTKTKKPKLNKAAKKLAKQKKKDRKKWESKHGYNKYTKELTRNLTFLSPDSTHTVAYMKIRSFTNGPYYKFYEESFAKIDSAKVQSLIIDLRGNSGGRLREIRRFYAFLTDKEFAFLAPSKMTKRMSYMYPTLHNKNWLIKSLAVVFYPIYTPYLQINNVKKIDNEVYFYLRTKPQEPEEKNYKGTIYLLIDGNSFSASSVLSAHLEATKRATIVGEETGGAYNGTIAGQMILKKLPNSKVLLRAGVFNIKTPHNATPDGYGVKPDVYIPTTSFEKDEQLDWVLEDIIQ